MTDQPAMPEPEDLLPEDVEGNMETFVEPSISSGDELAREGDAAEAFFDRPAHIPPAANAPHLANS